MYIKYMKRDELLSSVLIAFALFVMFGILFYFIYYDTGGFTPSSIMYLVFASISIVASIYWTIMYLIHERRPIYDYKIDFENEIIILNRLMKVKFQDIRLYAVRENRSEIKVFYRWHILNIIAFTLHNEKKGELLLEQADEIGKYAMKIGHRRLYNYNFLLPLLIVSLNLIFLFVQESFPFIHQTYKYLIVFGSTLGLSFLFILVNVLLLRRTYKVLTTEPKEKH